MSTTNTTKTVKTAEEKVALKDARILQLQNEKKKIIQQAKAKERKERNNRLYRRHGLLEKFMPELITITDEQYEVFIKTGIDTNYGRKRLGEIIAEGETPMRPVTTTTPEEDTAESIPNQPKASQSEA